VAVLLGVYSIAVVTHYLHLGDTADLFLISSFGAMAILVYVVPRAEFSQPRNIIGSNVIAAVVGVTGLDLLAHDILVASAVAWPPR